MNLQLSLKTKWFDLTKAGVKLEDYREITPYWIKRLSCFDESECTIEYAVEELLKGKENSIKQKSIYNGVLWSFNFPKKFTTTTLTLGYPKSTDTDRIIKFENAGIEIGYGKEEWGAEPNKLYFIIKHGKRL